MKWDNRRPIPWRRLLVEWALVTAAMLVATTVFTASPIGDTIGAVVLGGVVYLGLGAVLAKLGYQRATLRQIRSAARQPAPPTPPARRRPAPTRRTGGGPRRRR